MKSKQGISIGNHLRRTACLAVACGLFASQTMFGQASGTQTSNRFVVVNNTGLPDDAVFLTFNSAVTGTGGTSTTLSSGVAYSLEQLKGAVPGALPGGPVGNVPTFDLNTFSGRVYVALGNNTPMMNWPGPGGSNTVAGALELYVDPGNLSGHQNNGDISYVDYYSIPQNFKVKTLSGGSVSGISSIVTTSGTTIGDKLTSSTSITPTSARYMANYSVVDSNSSTVGTMTGLAQVLSPQNNASYPGFSSFFSAMQSSNASLTVASYQTPSGAPSPGNPKPGTLYGFAGVAEQNQTDSNPMDPGGTPANGTGSIPSWSGTRSENWFQEQSYSLTASYVADLTQGLPSEAVSRLASQNILPGTAGLRLFTSNYLTATTNNWTTDNVGDFGIYITATSLAANSATYGANPLYTLDWGGAGTPTTGTDGTTAQIVTTQNWNSLADRVVGDFMAGLTYGWGLAGSEAAGFDPVVSVYEHATATNTTAPLAGSIFDIAVNPTGPGSEPIGMLSTGEYFFLLDLQTGAGNIGSWTGGGIQPNENTWYDTYGVFQADTNAYAFPYGDRLQMNSPDIYWWPEGTSTELGTFYMEWTLNPGSYTYTAIPEPSTVGLLLISSLVIAVSLKRMRVPKKRQVES